MQTTDITVASGAVIQLAHEAQNESKEEHQADSIFLKRGVNSQSEELDAQDHEVLASMRDTAGRENLDKQEKLEESQMIFNEAEEQDYNMETGKLNENNGSDGDNDIALMEAEAELEGDLSEDQYTDISIDGSSIQEGDEPEVSKEDDLAECNEEEENVADLMEAEAELDGNLEEDQYLDVSIDGSSIQEGGDQEMDSDLEECNK